MVETRETGDLSGIDSHPVPVSSSHVEEMIERRDPLFAAKPTKNSKPVVCRLRSSAVEFRYPGVAARNQEKILWMKRV